MKFMYLCVPHGTMTSLGPSEQAVDNVVTYR